MTVYLLHFDQPLPRGISSQGRPVSVRHYIGYTEDLVGRILEHSETTWSPLPEPVVTDAGKRVTGRTHGPGATLMGVVNSRNIPWRLVRTWDGADQHFESRIKHRKKAPSLCPVCNPRAYRLAQQEQTS
jgi:hypothetical protein